MQATASKRIASIRIASIVRSLRPQIQATPKLREISANLRSGKLDLLKYLSSLCDNVETVNPKVQAVVENTYDRQRILNAGRKLLETYPDPEKRPPLFGVPVGIKDVINSEEFPTLCYSDLPSELWDDGKDAGCVAQLREAGAIVMCKVNTTEFAFTAAGPTKNPWNLEHSPGGSSQGSGAGVASHMFPISLGTQTIGSTIRPASFNGVSALKPTMNRTNTDGVMPISKNLDHIGIFTHLVGDLNLVAPVLVQDWRSNVQHKPIRDVKFAVPQGNLLDCVSDYVKTHFSATLSTLERAGIQIERLVDDIFPDLEDVKMDHLNQATAEMHLFHPFYQKYKHLYKSKTLELMEVASETSVGDLSVLLHKQKLFRARIIQEMEDRNVDCFLIPSSSDHAPKGFVWTGDFSMNGPWTWAGVPVINVPMPIGDGLPVGMSVVGRYNHDEELVSAATGIEEILLQN